MSTLSLRIGELSAIIFLLVAFLIFYNLAEQLDEED